MTASGYKSCMDTNRWIHDPVGAFRTWQETAATGADRRPFAPRSVVQHVAMFERFLRYLTERRVSLATFGPDHVVAFLAELDRTCARHVDPVRYAKLIDRLGRHLVDTGVRTIHPAGRTTRDFAWPDGGEPCYLPPDADAALQRHVQPRANDTPTDCRNRAIVALLLASGITSAEIRATTCDAPDLDAQPPALAVPRDRARPARRITLAEFALAPLAAWRVRSADTPASALLFPARAVAR